MVNPVQIPNPYADRATTLGERLMREARQAMENPSSNGTQTVGGRVIEDSIDPSTIKLADGKTAVNFAQGKQRANEIRAAKPEDIAEKLDQGLAEGRKAGDLFRQVMRGLFAFLGFKF